MTDILDLIDNAIWDARISDDAMRWMPEPPAAPAGQSDRRRTTVSAHMAFRLDLALMDAIRAWLQVNRLDPNRVPLDAHCTIKGRRIHCEVLLHRGGRLLVDRRTGDVARGCAKTRLHRRPTGLVLSWPALTVHLGPRPLLIDGWAYHRRTLARRRRR